MSLQIEDDAGESLRSFSHGGQRYVLGATGGRYNIRLTNNSDSLVEVVLSVDGRDVIHGRPSSLVDDRGYVVPARGTVLVRGFRTSMSSVAAFRFSSPSQSYAGRFGHAHTAGIIRAAAYRERPRPIAIPRPRPRPLPRHRPGIMDEDGRRAPAPPPVDKAPSSSSAQPQPARPDDRTSRSHGQWRRPRAGNLGTEFGEQTRSRVVQISFERAHRFRPDQRLTLRYDDLQGLEARGVLVLRPPPPPEPLVHPLVPIVVEHRFAQPPPAPWQDHWH